MPVREGPAQPPPPPQEEPPPYPADKARGAEIILRSPVRKAIFFGGLIGVVLLVFLLGFVR